MEYIDKLIKAQRIVIKQYAYGTVRIDDGASLIKKLFNKNEIGGGDGGGGTVSVCGFAGTNSRVDVAFGINTNNSVDGEIIPMIYLPPADALVFNGENVQVQPPNGALQQGQCYYSVPIGSDLWCAIFVNTTEGRYEAGIFDKNHLPTGSVFKFHVAKVPRNLDINNVVQYALGTAFIYTDQSPFAIVADNQQPAVQNVLGAGEQADGENFGDETYDTETAWDAYDENDYETTHHFENCYYSFGELLCEANVSRDIKVESYANKIVCLRVQTVADGSSQHKAELTGYDTLGEVQAAQKDVNYVTKPLYKLDLNGKVIVDFRQGIGIQVMEDLT